MGLRFLITFDDDNKKKITTVKEIAFHYIKNEFIIDILTTLPLMRVIKPEIDFIEGIFTIRKQKAILSKTNEIEDMKIRLIYIVKVLRIKKAYYLLNTRKFKSIVF